MPSLPLMLPNTDNVKPSGTPKSPLANIATWVNTAGRVAAARRETSTLLQVRLHAAPLS